MRDLKVSRQHIKDIQSASISIYNLTNVLFKKDGESNILSRCQMTHHYADIVAVKIYSVIVSNFYDNNCIRY